MNLSDFVTFVVGADYGFALSGRAPMILSLEFGDWMRRKYKFATGLYWGSVMLEKLPSTREGMNILIEDIAQYCREMAIRASPR